MQADIDEHAEALRRSTQTLPSKIKKDASQPETAGFGDVAGVLDTALDRVALVGAEHVLHGLVAALEHAQG